MARPRKPTEVLKLVSAFKKNPNRTRPLSPRSDGEIGDAPDNLSEAEKIVWQEIVRKCPAGVLTEADGIVTELLARLLAKFRRDWLTGQEFTQLGWCLVRLGMTPADRSRITAAGNKEPVNPFSEFAA